MICFTPFTKLNNKEELNQKPNLITFCMLSQNNLLFKIFLFFFFFIYKKVMLIFSSKNLMPFLSFSDNLLHAEVWIILRWCTKHAQFWFGVQFPLKVCDGQGIQIEHI